MKSTWPFNPRRHRRSLTHGGQNGVMHHKGSARPVTLAVCRQTVDREPPLEPEAFARLLDALIPDDEAS